MAKSIEEQLLDIARERFHNAYDPQSEPTLHIVLRAPTLWRVVISKYDYCFAQSGSDWAEHNILYGTVTVDGEQIVRHDFQHHHEKMSERFAEEYRPDDVVKQFMDTIDPTKERCSKCGSMDTVVWERFFGWAKYACNSCGYKATE